MVGAQAVFFHDAAIGGDVIAFGQHEDIAGHDVGSGDFDFPAFAAHARVSRQQAPEDGHGLLGAIFLPE